MIGRIAAAMLALAFAATAAQAQTDVIALNKASDAAWNEGRVADALDLGEQAWRAAEEEWGPTDNTALLAMSYANILILAGQRDRAIEPARRLLDLVESGAAPSVDPAQARLLDAFAKASGENLDDDAADALEAALVAVEDTGAPPDAFLWMGWLTVAQARMDDRDWDEAYGVGDHVLNIMSLTGDVPDRARANAAVIAGVAAAAEREYVDAYRALSSAMDYISERITVDGKEVMNPEWATLSVWRAAFWSANESFTKDKVDDFLDDFMGLGGGESGPCWIGWKERPPGVYPRTAERKGMVGATLVEYEVNASGEVINAEVMASAPDESFGEAALDALARWEADPETLDGCEGYRITTSFYFQFR